MTYQDLMEAIAEKIAGQFPGRMIYRDFCPTDFQRPSFYLYVTQADYEDANLGLVEWHFSAELTLFAATDAYDIQSTEALRRDQLTVLSLFGGPAIQVGDRFIGLTVQGTAPGPGEAYVVFSSQWLDVRPGMETEETTPKMEEIKIDMNGKDDE